MAEWHITPDYIVNNWTDELFDLMVEKLKERKTKESEAIKGTSSTKPDDNALTRMGSMVKVIKHGD